MHTTPASLLERLRDPAQSGSWERFVKLYTPLLYHWANRLDLQDVDAHELVGEVFLTLVQKLPRFEYEKGKRFRGWLWTLTLNTERMRRRKRTVPLVDDSVLEQLAVASGVEAVEEAEYCQFVIGQALKLIQAEFPLSTWKAYWEVVVHGRRPVDVADELGMTVRALYVAKSRVLRKLREELQGLVF